MADDQSAVAPMATADADISLPPSALAQTGEVSVADIPASSPVGNNYAAEAPSNVCDSSILILGGVASICGSVLSPSLVPLPIFALFPGSWCCSASRRQIEFGCCSFFILNLVVDVPKFSDGFFPNRPFSSPKCVSHYFGSFLLPRCRIPGSPHPKIPSSFCCLKFASLHHSISFVFFPPPSFRV
jgi:hypothetical protein